LEVGVVNRVNREDEAQRGQKLVSPKPQSTV
jgi:hypothetical protein